MLPRLLASSVAGWFVMRRVISIHKPYEHETAPIYENDDEKDYHCRLLGWVGIQQHSKDQKLCRSSVIIAQNMYFVPFARRDVIH